MLVCLAQHVAVLASLAGPLGWVWAPAGKACDEACAARGARCSEARWPATEPAFVGVAAALKVPCAVTAPGGLFEAPATLPSGACAWLGPERTWDRGESGLSGQRCSRTPGLHTRRLCPCDHLGPGGGVAAWTDSPRSWAFFAGGQGLVAGVQAVDVMSAAGVDTFFVSQNSAHTPNTGGKGPQMVFTAEAGSRGGKLKATTVSDQALRSSQFGVLKKASTDLCHAVVFPGNRLETWAAGGPISTPYDTSDDGTLEPIDGLSPVDFGGNPGDRVYEEVRRGPVVVSLTSTKAAFAVLFSNGSVLCWGDPGSGGAAPAGLSGVTQVYATRAAFAALHADGSVTAWGHPDAGGALLKKLTGAVSIVATLAAFAALLESEPGSYQVEAWGHADMGGDLGPYRAMPGRGWACTEVWDEIDSVSECAAAANVLNVPPYVHEGFNQSGKTSEEAMITELTGVPRGCWVLSLDGTLSILFSRPSSTTNKTIDPSRLARVCKANPTAPYTVLKGSKVTGLYATAKGFMAVTSSKTPIAWPCPGGGQKQLADIGAVDAVYATYDAFILFNALRKKLTTVAVVGNTFWTESLDPPAVVAAPADGITGLREVRSTRGAALALWTDGTVTSWRARPEALQHFVLLSDASCGLSAGRRVISRESCAEHCLNTFHCIAFEYKVDGQSSYCVFGGQCSPVVLSTTSSVELYVKSTSFLKPRPQSFELIGAGSCSNGSVQLLPFKAMLTTRAFCEEACASISCTAYQFSPTEQECGLFSDEGIQYTYDTDDFLCFARPTMQTDAITGRPVNPASQSHKRCVPGASSLRILKDIQVGHADGGWTVWSDVAFTSDCTLKFVSSQSSLHGIPTRFSFSTGELSPELDPIAWTLTAESNSDTRGRTFVVHQVVLPDNPFSDVLLVPTARSSSTRDLLFSTDFKRYAESSSEDVGYTFTFTQLRARGSVVYTRWDNTSIRTSLLHVTIPSVPSAQACAHYCQTCRHPANCTAFTYPSHGPGTNCSLYFDAVRTEWVPDDNSTLYELFSRTTVVANLAPDINYGEDAAPSNVTGVVAVAATSRAFAVVLSEDSPADSVWARWQQSVVAWGGDLYGRIAPDIGEKEYLGDGILGITAGLRTVMVRRFGSEGHDECTSRPCVRNNEVPPGQSGDQVCEDPDASSDSARDFMCICNSAPTLTVGYSALCVVPPAGTVWPLFLLYLPLVGALARSYYVKRKKQAEASRQITGLCEMYLLHASLAEQIALNSILSDNSGKELVLLEALVPDYKQRSTEVLLFLLWQNRMQTSNSQPRVLSSDLIRYVQAFIFGLDSLRPPPAPPMTPLGYVVVKAALMHNVSTKKSQGRRATKGEEEEGGPGEMWSSDLAVPLALSEKNDDVEENALARTTNTPHLAASESIPLAI